MQPAFRRDDCCGPMETGQCARKHSGANLLRWAVGEVDLMLVGARSSREEARLWEAGPGWEAAIG